MNKILKVVIFLLMLQAVLSQRRRRRRFSGRIVGGTVTTWRRHPYIIVLRYGSYFICGGSLIARRVVLTAAHCLDEGYPSDYTATGGASRLTNTGAMRRAVEIIPHPEFDPNTGVNDIGAIILEAPMPSHIKVIPLQRQRVPTRGQFVVLGHGMVAQNGIVSNALRMARIPIVPKKLCRLQYKNKNVLITNRMVCAAKLGERDACSGDSGGPLVCAGRLCGIVSFGYGCARRNYAGVYTKVPSYMNFIEDIMMQYP